MTHKSFPQTNDDAGPVIQRIRELIEQKMSTANQRKNSKNAPVVLIDGRSGSGKTSLAQALSTAWNGKTNLVHLDDIYPGWHGLAAATQHVHTELLTAEKPRWQRYDWELQRSAEWHYLDPSLPLIIEGVGCLSRKNALLATVSVWLELDEKTRYLRAKNRDNGKFEEQWKIWSDQELAFISAENPEKHADMIFKAGM